MFEFVELFYVVDVVICDFDDFVVIKKLLDVGIGFFGGV